MRSYVKICMGDVKVSIAGESKDVDEKFERLMTVLECWLGIDPTKPKEPTP